MEAWAGGRVLLNLGQWPRWDFVFGLLAISIQETVSLDGFHVATRDPAPPQALGTESGGSEMDLGVAVGCREEFVSRKAWECIQNISFC